MGVNVEEIHEWRGQDVVDAAGEKIGKLAEVYYDAVSGQPAFISIKSGLLGRRNHLASLAGASVSRDTIRVTQSKETIEGIEVAEVDGVLDDADIRRAAQVFRVNLGPNARFESASLRDERRAAAQGAAERAADLEQEAANRAQDAQAAREQAAQAGQEAAAAEAERDRAAQEAAQARAEAARLAQDVPPGG